MKQFGKYLTELTASAIKKAIERFVKDGAPEAEAKETVETYDKLNQKNQLTVNIQTIKYEDLKKLVDEKKDKGTKTQKTKTEKLEGAKKVFENDKVVVLIPLTHEASCKYGSGTKWCTTAKDPRHYNNYMEEGILYYLLPKDLNDMTTVVIDGETKKVLNKIAFRFKDGDLVEIRTPENVENHVSKYKDILEKFNIPGKVFRTFGIDDKHITLHTLNWSSFTELVDNDYDDDIQNAFINNKGLRLYDNDNIEEALNVYKINKENQKLLVKILDKKNPNWHKNYKDVVDALKDFGVQSKSTPAHVFLNKYPDLKKMFVEVINVHAEPVSADTIKNFVIQQAKDLGIIIRFTNAKKFNLLIDKNIIDVSDTDTKNSIIKKLASKKKLTHKWDVDSLQKSNEFSVNFNKDLHKELTNMWNDMVSDDTKTPNLFKEVYNG